MTCRFAGSILRLPWRDLCALRAAVGVALALVALVGCTRQGGPRSPGPAATLGPTTVAPTPPSSVPAVVAPPASAPLPPAARPPAGPPLVAVAVFVEGHGAFVMLRSLPDGQSPSTRLAPRDGVDVRALGGDTPPDGRPVRIYCSPSGFCDGTLGAPVELRSLDGDDNELLHRASAAPVAGCAFHDMALAVIDPPPAASQLVTGPVSDDVVAAARAAAAHVVHGGATLGWRVETSRCGDTSYAMVAGPTCPADAEEGECSGDAAVAVARSRAGAAPEVGLARRAHFPWDSPVDAYFDFGPLVDVDGDGTVELRESAGSDGPSMMRLVRVGARLPGDFVWRVDSDSAVLTLGYAAPPRALPALRP